MSARRRAARRHPGALRLGTGAAVGAAERRGRTGDPAEAVVGAILGVLTVACLTDPEVTHVLHRAGCEAAPRRPVEARVISGVRVPVETGHGDVIEGEIVEAAS